MKKKSKSDYSRLKLGFTEMKSYFDYLSEANDVLDGKLIALISTIGIILTFFGAYSFDHYQEIPCLIIVLLFFLIISFVIFVYHIIRGLFPKNVAYPFDGTYEAINENFINKPNVYKVYEQMIVNYEDNLRELKSVNCEKAKNLKIAFYFYVAIVILTLSINFFFMFD